MLSRPGLTYCRNSYGQGAAHRVRAVARGRRIPAPDRDRCGGFACAEVAGRCGDRGHRDRCVARGHRCHRVLASPGPTDESRRHPSSHRERSVTDREYLALEQAASDILIYGPQRLPNLLQTPEYLQASMAADLLGARAGNLAKLTLDRQKTLGERRHRLTAVVGEAALRQMHGDAGVIRHQLMALAHVDERVVIQVLPPGCGAPSSGPTTILRFAAPPGLGAAYLPALSGGICPVSQRDVASYIRAFERLRAAALTSEFSAQLIRTTAAGTNGA